MGVLSPKNQVVPENRKEDVFLDLDGFMRRLAEPFEKTIYHILVFSQKFLVQLKLQKKLCFEEFNQLFFESARAPVAVYRVIYNGPE